VRTRITEPSTRAPETLLFAFLHAATSHIGFFSDLLIYPQGVSAPPRVSLFWLSANHRILITWEGVHSDYKAPIFITFHPEEEENALAKINDSGFHSAPTSILAKTETSFEGLKERNGG
jgi:hypothetical protein